MHSFKKERSASKEYRMNCTCGKKSPWGSEIAAREAITKHRNLVKMRKQTNPTRGKHRGRGV